MRNSARRLDVPLTVVETADLLNVQELLQYVASLRLSNVPAPLFTDRQRGSEVNARLFFQLQSAETETGIGAVVTEYYQQVAAVVRRRTRAAPRGRCLSQNYFYPYTGRISDMSYYLDAHLTDFFFNPESGVVDPSWRLPVLVEMYTGMERRALGNADTVFCFSQSLENALLKIPGMTGLRTVVLGGGPAFYELPTLSVTRSAGQFPLLFVGLDFDRKGGRVLLRAMETLWDLHRVGLRAVTMKECHVEAPGVDFRSPCSKSELVELYRSSGIFLFPTLFEPFGLVVCEAMAHGLPVVGTRVGAVPEIVGPAGEAFLVDVGPVDAMAAALVEKVEMLLRDEELRARIGMLGRERIAGIYNWDVVADRLIRSLAGAE